MTSERKFSRASLAMWTTAALAVGVVVGWVVTGNLGADWVGAVGTWIGALGTIGAIAWAIHTFREENEQKIRARIASEQQQAETEKALAEGVRVSCRGGGGSGHAGQMDMTSIHVDFANETSHTIGIVAFDLPEIDLKPEPPWPPTLASGDSITRTVTTVPFHCPDDEFSGRPLVSLTPTILYRINGVTWQRVGTAAPTRMST